MSTGLRFVQFYFGTADRDGDSFGDAVPIFHRAKVYTAYEYLEQRFDAKTRSLVTMVFLIERGLSAGNRAGGAGDRAIRDSQVCRSRSLR